MHSIIPFQKQTAYNASDYLINYRFWQNEWKWKVCVLTRLISCFVVTQNDWMRANESNSNENVCFDIACTVKDSWFIHYLNVWCHLTICTEQYKQKSDFWFQWKYVLVVHITDKKTKLIFTKTLTQERKKNNKMKRTAWFVCVFLF